MEAYMKYPAAHEAELLEILPAPIGQKSLNPRQSYKVGFFWNIFIYLGLFSIA
jgi:hypothetical protein